MSVFEKMNIKDHKRIAVLNAPSSFETEVEALQGVEIIRSLADDVGFVLHFVKTQKDLDAAAANTAKQTKGDTVVWFAYPKGTSKKYKCEFNRDTGWKALGDAGFEPVRSVAIDEDWTGLRFRRAEFIKAMKRGVEHRMSAAGRAKGTNRVVDKS